MVYLNQAATTYPKPQCVRKAHAAALCRIPEGQFRSRIPAGDESVFEQCRRNLGKILGIRDYGRIFFSSGATDSSNLLIYGLDLAGRNVVTTQMEHNSILRPLYNLRDRVGSVTVVPCDNCGFVDPDRLEDAISDHTAAVIVNHCSNVTGAVQDIPSIAEAVRRRGKLLIVDASQSAGCMPIRTDVWGIDALIFTGHKALFGVQGTGGYYVRKGIPFRPARFGGTGKDSSRVLYDPETYEYEVGTQNEAGIAALNAGVGYILRRGVEEIEDREQKMIASVYDRLSEIENVTVYGDRRRNHGPVLSFNIRGLSPSDTAYILQNSYEIVTRAGLQCAPFIHKSLGSDPLGTVRISISDLTEEDEIEFFLHAVRETAYAVRGSRE